MAQTNMLKTLILILFLSFGVYANCCCVPDGQAPVTVSGHVTALDKESSVLVNRGAVHVITYVVVNGVTSWYMTVAANSNGDYSMQLPMCQTYVIVPAVMKKSLSRFPGAFAIFDNMPSYVFTELEFDRPGSNFELSLFYLPRYNRAA